MSDNPNLDMVITFPGGKKVDAEFMGFTIKTDQHPRSGGEGSAPEPFTYFLSSIGTCAGIYVLGFCQSRDIPTDGVRIIQRLHPNEKGMVGKIELLIEVPPEFPEKYHSAIVRAADMCAVKKFIENPAPIETKAVVAQ